MPIFSNGSFRIFRLAGIDVFLNWTWFIVAVIEIEARSGRYSSVIWNVLEYLALFLIVLTHEFGHALACRQVGGIANRIMLWPFGGIAYVDPPQRAGAMLWSIVAGPLVNVALAPVLLGAFLAGRGLGWSHTHHDLYRFIFAVLWIDIGLLIFNILPIYPLDGGKILWSLLWFVMGRGRALMVATVLGLVGIVGFVGLAAYEHEIWFGLISVYLLMSCWSGLQRSRLMMKIENMPRRTGFACPSCKTAPPLGAKWKCSLCKVVFDTFETNATCPNCGDHSARTMCGFCAKAFPISEWQKGSGAGAYVINGEAVKQG